MTLFNLKKTNPKHLCEAMRCTDAVYGSIPGELWGKDTVDLCAKHIAMAADYAEKSPPEGTATDAPTPSSALANAPDSTPVPAIPANWGERFASIHSEAASFEDQAKMVLAVVQRLPVASHQDMEDVAEYLRDAKTMRNVIESREKEITGPLTAVIRRCRELLSPAKKGWEEIEGRLRGLLSQAALQEQQRNQELMDAAAKAHAEGTDVSAPVRSMTTSSDLFGVTVRFVWNVIVEDVSKIPEEYTTRSANVGKLKEYAAKFEGQEPTPLPGVKFVKDAPLRVQSVRGVS